MDKMALAPQIHVIAIVAWIGGVYFVTMVVLPAVRGFAAPEDRIRTFGAIENRFSWHARVITLVAGGSGFYMTHLLDAWDRYSLPGYWWVHAMTLIWALFTLALVVLEPLFLHVWFGRRARQAPEQAFALLTRLHQVLLAASLLTVFGAVMGAHGQ